jgi:HlyD family secretion protein
LATQADLDASAATLGQTRGLLRSSSAQVAEARAQLDRAQLDLEHSVIRSPVDGTVISRSIDVGQAVASTLQAPTLFTIAQDLSHMQVHAAVDEADIGQVRAGQSASFTVDAFRARSFPAVVHEVRNAPQTTQNVVTYDVVLDVDNGSGELRPGMTANVAILIEQRHQVAAVPNEALRFRPPAEVLHQHGAPGEPADAWGAAVYLERGGRAVRTPIELGVSDGNLTEVSGLEPGREVIIDVAGSKRAPSAGGFRRDL